ncbi:MAG: hypothetical protein ACI9WU_003607 [Myxococcota bacterium]
MTRYRSFGDRHFGFAASVSAVTFFAALMRLVPSARAVFLVGYHFVNRNKQVTGDSGHGQWTIVSLSETYGGPGLNRFAAETVCANFSLLLGTPYEPVLIDSLPGRRYPPHRRHVPGAAREGQGHHHRL